MLHNTILKDSNCVNRYKAKIICKE